MYRVPGNCPIPVLIVLLCFPGSRNMVFFSTRRASYHRSWISSCYRLTSLKKMQDWPPKIPPSHVHCSMATMQFSAPLVSLFSSQETFKTRTRFHGIVVLFFFFNLLPAFISGAILSRLKCSVLGTHHEVQTELFSVEGSKWRRHQSPRHSSASTHFTYPCIHPVIRSHNLV